MSHFTSGALPGIRAPQTSEETQVTWSGRHGQNLVATRSIVIDDETVDAGGSPTTTLRGGNVLALDDATGLAHLYDPDANDGTQIAAGILEHAQDMLQGGAPAQRFTQMIVHGLIKEGELHGLDARARQQLASRMLFGRSLTGGGDLMHPRGVYRKDGNYTLTASDNGLLFVATAAVAFTLPTKENGLAFRFLQTADANMSIVGSSDIVCAGSASASTVAFQTSDEKIGSHVLVECLYIGTGTLRWVLTNLGGTTATVS